MYSISQKSEYKKGQPNTSSQRMFVKVDLNDEIGRKNSYVGVPKSIQLDTFPVISCLPDIKPHSVVSA
jgi:hypothetical protein